MPQSHNKKLLVITVEEVLLVAATGGVKSEFKPDYEYDDGFTTYLIFLRPQLRQFLDYCLANFRVALWSEYSPAFVQDALQRIFGENYDSGVFEFIWTADQCVPPSDGRYIVEGYVHRHRCKSFDKIVEAGYLEDEIIIVDSNPKHWEPYCELPEESWVFAGSICKMFGNIAINDKCYSPDDTSLLDVMEKLADKT